MSTIALDNRVFFQNKILVPKQGQSINLFIVGVGLVGETLLEQIQKQNSEISVCGIANSKNALLETKGIDLRNWKNKLKKRTCANSSDYLIMGMLKLKLPNSVFVDCTSSNELPKKYEKILNAGIPIVTPNKKANSGSYKNYARLNKLSLQKNVPFIYETNVGAGLPIISTIQNIVASGDKIIKIEGIFSGTLSYIFNIHSKSDKPISQIITEAKNNGYTEPDPREDLNGLDMARKLLILGRIAGCKLELEEIKIGRILPKKLFKLNSVSEFFEKLKEVDDLFEEKKNRAEKKKKALRYVATLEENKAKMGLKTVSASHPFFNLTGCDNIITITTKRYNKNPIVIQGPGAGREVTAGGLLSNIMGIFRN